MIWKNMTAAERLRVIIPDAEAGISASQIATRFTDEPSRSAILGLCNRNGVRLSSPGGRKPDPSKKTRPRRSRAKNATPPPRPRQVPASPPAQPKPPTPVEPPPLYSEPMNFMQVTDQNRCRWPLWEKFDGPETSLFCGAPRMGDRPYCEHHDHASCGAGAESERRAHRDLKRHIMRQRGIV